MNLYERLLSLHFTWRDAVDVIVVSFIIYYILTLIRGTRAMQISIGLVVLASTYFVARAFDLPALEAISREILFYLPFAIIVLFQHEIRRALARMGLLAFFGSHAEGIAFEPVARATSLLAWRRRWKAPSGCRWGLAATPSRSGPGHSMTQRCTCPQRPRAWP